MSTIPLAELKDELNIPSGVTTNDAELQRKLDAAEGYYAEHVRPLPGEDVELRANGAATIILPQGVEEVTAAAYTAGGTITLADLDLDPVSGLLHTSYLTTGTRNVTLTVTVGALPLHHRQAILWDVAEAWTRTQRGGGSGRPSFGGGEIEDTSPTRPINPYPRIEALAGPGLA